MAVDFWGAGDASGPNQNSSNFKPTESTSSGPGLSSTSVAEENKRLTHAVNALFSGLTEQKKRIDSLENDAQKSAGELKRLVDEQGKKIEESSTKNTEILAVFVGLFTFVSIDFQLFKSPQEWNAAAGLVLMSAGILVCFVALVDLVISHKFDKYKMLRLGFLYALALICIFFGWKFFHASLNNPKFFPKPPEITGPNPSTTSPPFTDQMNHPAPPIISSSTTI